jgi:hypothetical protein
MCEFTNVRMCEFFSAIDQKNSHIRTFAHLLLSSVRITRKAIHDLNKHLFLFTCWFFRDNSGIENENHGLHNKFFHHQQKQSIIYRRRRIGGNHRGI